MYDNRIVNWSELISITSSGLYIADYVTIRKAITKRFKEIYGDDIDVSTASADGVYLENYCLLLNNILQGFKALYADLDVNTASGKALDILSALSNIYRKAATKSSASLKVTLDVNEQPYSTSSISFLDGNGNTWTCKASDYQLQQLVFQPGETKTIVVICDELGPIVAEAGWIYRLASSDVVMTVVQEQDAAVGQNRETDIQLRERRSMSVGTSSTTVLEGLVGLLYKIDGIEDVKIYNNNTNSSKTARDFVTIPEHSVYILLRYAPNINISDNLLGTTIYEAMTPGIPTTEFVASVTPGSISPNSTAHSFEYTAAYLGDIITLDVQQMVYWTEVEKVAPTFEITITPNNYYASNDNYTAKLIADRVMTFANSLSIGKDLLCRDVDDEVCLADPLFRGRRTFSVKSIKRNGNAIPLSGIVYGSFDTAFYYTSYSITTSGDDVVITLS